MLQLLLNKPTDLKSAMQAISNGGSADMARLLLKAVKEKQIKDKEEERRGWRLMAGSWQLAAWSCLLHTAALCVGGDGGPVKAAVVQRCMYGFCAAVTLQVQ